MESRDLSSWRHGRRALLVLGLGAWLGLVLWRLPQVPGMTMDEAWVILSARGEWPPENPLSGLTAYSGPFPALLLKLFGTAHALWVLRGASVLANGALLAVLALLLRRAQPAQGYRGWGLPLLASMPVWLVGLRIGIEVTMFTPLLAVLGLYLLTRPERAAAFGAGLAWGLLIYNHLIGACFPLSLALAWLLVYRRLPPLRWAPFIGGLALGLAPRVVALLLYHDHPLTGSAAKYSLSAAVADLRWLPRVLWEALQGTTVYLQYTGRLAHLTWSYWMLAPLLLVPWLLRPRLPPKPVWLALIATLLHAVLVTVVAPYMAVRFLILPLLGLALFVALLGGAAIERDVRWGWLVRPVGAALVIGNLYYTGVNFYGPWHSRRLGVTTFFMGDRSPHSTTWGYLPKEGLVQALEQLSPRPEQIVSNSSLTRPLRALLSHTGIRCATWSEADRKLRSIFVDYNYGKLLSRRCLPVPGGRMCFSKPEIVDTNYLLYR